MIHNPNARHRDPLTGAVTEDALLRFLDAVLGMAEPVGPQVGLLCLNIDGLGVMAVNDGDAVRDAALLGVADRMHDHIRNQDLVGRLDDGFGICLADIFPAQVVAAADRLRRAVAAQPVPTPIGAIMLTCSIGLVLSRGGPENSAMMLQRARDARGTAQQAGGNQLTCSL